MNQLGRTYGKWQGMLRRCNDIKAHNYPYYGGRGIKVCDRWQGKGGFDRFVEDIGLAPDGLTLGRIDNERGYEPGNCRWETWRQQALNRRKSSRPKDTSTLRYRALAAGLPYMAVYFRVKRLGWTEERALSEPLHSKTDQRPCWTEERYRKTMATKASRCLIEK